MQAGLGPSSSSAASVASLGLLLSSRHAAGEGGVLEKIMMSLDARYLALFWHWLLL
jgi:polyphosphate kinase 2 (PPK2 family)